MSEEGNVMKEVTTSGSARYQELQSDHFIVDRVEQMSRKVESQTKKITFLGVLLVIVIVVLFTALLFKEKKIEKVLEYITKQEAKAKGEKTFLPINVPLGPEGSGMGYNHPPRTFSYPTMGIPQPGKTFNNTLVADSDLAEFGRVVNELMKPYNDTNCKFQRFGLFEIDAQAQIDGTYIVCDNFFSEAYAVVNIGINGWDRLGCDIISRYPLLNYQYDCTNPQKPDCNYAGVGKEKDEARNSFQSICLGQTTESTKDGVFYSFEDMLKTHNLTGKRIILKIDCEGCEYNGLKYVPTSVLDNVDAILGQFHFGLGRERWGVLDIFKSIGEKFVNVNYHVPSWLCYEQERLRKHVIAGAAIEVTLINKRLINIGSGSRSFALNDANFPGCAPEGNVLAKRK